MALAVTSRTSLPPIQAADMTDYLRLSEQQNDIVSALTAAALAFVEQQTWTTLVTTGYRLTLDRFPKERWITIPRPPLQSVLSVQYIDVSGQQQTLDPSVYIVDADSKPGRIVLRSGQSWPSITEDAASVRVNFTAGYTTVPPLLIQCIQFLVAHWFENREAATNDHKVTEVPFAVQSIIDLHSFPEVFA